MRAIIALALVAIGAVGYAHYTGDVDVVQAIAEWLAIASERLASL